MPITTAVSEDTIEHISVAIINASALVIVALISYLSGKRRNQQQDVEEEE